MSGTSELDAWRDLMETESGIALCVRIGDDLAKDGRPTASQVAAWRRGTTQEVVRAAIELTRARRASGQKFRVFGCEGAPCPVLDVSSGEQASPWQIAGWKASRFRDRGCGLVLDLCCGAGADAAELAGAGLDVEAMDLSPLRAWMCARNAGCRASEGDVTCLGDIDAPVHIDPSRRDEADGRRRHSIDAMAPGIEEVTRLTATAGCVKLGPGVDAGALHAIDPSSSVEYVSLRGRVSQALWWRGVLAHGERVGATLIGQDGEMLRTMEGAPAPAKGRTPLGRYIHTVDPAIERASLIGTLAAETGLGVVHPSLGLLTGDSLSADGGVKGYEVVAEMPFRREKVRDWLRGHDGGIVSVKTRGGACDPDVEQKAWRCKGSVAYCVFVLRFDERVRAIVTRPPG